MTKVLLLSKVGFGSVCLSFSQGPDFKHSTHGIFTRICPPTGSNSEKVHITHTERFGEFIFDSTKRSCCGDKFPHQLG